MTSDRINTAYQERHLRLKREAIELCGKNRGPHDWIGIEWRENDGVRRLTRMMCRVCLANVSVGIMMNYGTEL